MSELYTHEHIEAFLSDELSPDERARMNARIQSDPALKTEVERHKRARKVVDYALYQDVKRTLQEIDAESTHEHSGIRMIGWKQVAIAASVLVVLGLVAAIWVRDAFSDTTLAQEQFAIVEGDLFRGSPAQELSPQGAMLEAERLFDDAQFAAAAEIYEREAARETLYTEQAEWNLLLCYLATDQEDAFDTLLTQLTAQQNHMFHERALALKEKIQHPLYRIVNQ